MPLATVAETPFTVTAVAPPLVPISVTEFAVTTAPSAGSKLSSAQVAPPCTPMVNERTTRVSLCAASVATAIAVWPPFALTVNGAVTAAPSTCSVAVGVDAVSLADTVSTTGEG